MSATASGLPTTRIWALDSSHSTVGFRVKHHAVGTYRARFSEFEATYDANAGKLTGSVETSSLETFEMLAEHLKAPDYLDVEKYPKITFESTSIDLSDGVLTIVGDLTMKGVTKTVTTTGAILGPSKVEGWDGSPATNHIGIDLETTIDRRDYGLDDNSELLSGEMNLGWDVTLEFSLEFATEAQ